MTLSRVGTRAHLVTLRRFDSKPGPEGQNSPLIPCERRLRIMEIREFQEVTFGRVFWKQGLWEALWTYFGDTSPF